ncbi:MAG: hypothetical protein H7Y38_07040 [Armatimonadetes bacterium]|nr:hypothetical protein [Armatimonadota bacterium]
MQVGGTRIIIRPALMMIIGGAFVGMGGLAFAAWYALGPQQSYGLANPTRWAFGTEQGANATLTMLTPEAQKNLVITRSGSGNVNADTGFKVDKKTVGATPSGVYIRNTITLDAAKNNRDLTFSFQGSAASPQPITFTVRDAQVKKGGGLLWSHTFVVQGDWESYRQTVPNSALGNGKMQYMVVAGHLGAKPGELSLRHIYLK